MSLDAWLTIGILILTFGALLATKLPPVTVFLGALTLSVTFGLAPLDRSRPIADMQILRNAPLRLAITGQSDFDDKGLQFAILPFSITTPVSWLTNGR